MSTAEERAEKARIRELRTDGYVQTRQEARDLLGKIFGRS